MWRALAVGGGVGCVLVLIVVTVDELATWVLEWRKRRAERRARARVRFYSRGRSGLDVLRDSLGTPADPRRRPTTGATRRGSVRNP